VEDIGLKGELNMAYQDNLGDQVVQGVNGAVGNLPGRSAWTPGQAGQSNQGGIFDTPLRGVRRDVENQIGQALDHYASHVPGGERFTPEAKRIIAGALDGLQQQLENEAAARMGGLGRGLGHQGNNNSGVGSL
jgi:hypothetical protein